MRSSKYISSIHPNSALLASALLGITVHYTSVPCTKGIIMASLIGATKNPGGWELLGPKKHESLLIVASNRLNTIGQGYDGFWLVALDRDGAGFYP
jgi:hypothetical protein